LGTVVGFLPDSRRLVLRSVLTTRVRDVLTGQDVLSLPAAPRHEYAACSPDGRYVATGDGTATAVWDAAGGQLLYSGQGQRPAVSPDGRRLTTIIGNPAGSWEQPGEVKLWDAAAGAELRTLRGDNWLILFAAFTSDGRQVVTASAGERARVWDADTGDEVRHF